MTRAGFSMESDKVGILEVGELVTVLETRVNEANTTRVRFEKVCGCQSGLRHPPLVVGVPSSPVRVGRQWRRARACISPTAGGRSNP